MRDDFHFLRGLLLSLLLFTAAAHAAHARAPQGASLAESLLLGEKIERELESGHRHSFRVELKRGSFLRVLLDEKRINVVVRLIHPRGHKLVEANFRDYLGLEPVSFEAADAGVYTVEVVPFNETAPAGKYSLTARVKDAASADDVEVLTAERLLLAAEVGANSGDKTMLQRAAALNEQSLAIWRRRGDEYWQALALTRLAFRYYQLSETRKALDLLEEALPLRRKIGDTNGEAASTLLASACYSEAGDRQKTRAYLDRAYALYEQMDDPEGKASVLWNQAVDYENAGENADAYGFLITALYNAQAARNLHWQARILNRIGHKHLREGLTQPALDALMKAEPLARHDKVLSMSVQEGLAEIARDRGHLPKALQYYGVMLALAKEAAHKEGEARALGGIGSVRSLLGEQAEAHELFRQALKLFQESGSRAGEASALVTLAQSGRSPEVIVGHYTSAMEIYRQLGDKRGEAEALFAMGSQILSMTCCFSDKATLLQYSTGYLYQASKLFTSLKAYERATAVKLELGRAGVEMGDLLTSLGKTADARQIYEGAAGVLNEGLRLATFLSDKGVQEAALYGQLMMTARGTSRPGLAIFYGKRSVALLQRFRERLRTADKETQKLFLATVESTYRDLAELLIAEGRLAEAQQVITYFKDQEFYDFARQGVEGAVAHENGLALTPTESAAAERLDAYGNKLGGASKEIIRLADFIMMRNFESAKQLFALADKEKLSPVQQKDYSSELLKVMDEYHAYLTAGLAEQFAQPAAAKEAVAGVSEVAEMQATLRDLQNATGKKPVALYMLLGRDKYHVLLVTPDSVAAASHPMARGTLNGKAVELWQLLSSPHYDPRPAARALYEVVFKPVAAQVEAARADVLLWSLDGALRYVPVAALHDGERYLVERYESAVMTRSSRERLTRAVSARWRGVGFGASQGQSVESAGERLTFEPLPGVAVELGGIFGERRGAIPGIVLQDRAFTKESFLSQLKRRNPVVHIASHFNFRPGDEERSFLLLGDGGKLTLSEMKANPGIFGGIELLTLSACNTAAQQSGANGREIDGMAEMAQRLGAASVMATLWAVSDAGTPSFMRDFYRFKQEPGGKPASKVAALRSAQLVMLNGERPPDGPTQRAAAQAVRGPQEATRAAVLAAEKSNAPKFKADAARPYAHPYYWAAFVIIGNWK